MEDKDSSTLPEDLTSLHKEIDLIQDCISRMAKNSFMLKGWAVTVVVIVWTIIGMKNLGVCSLFLLLVPTFMFWILDAFYLMTEKRYRKLYAWVLSERLEKKSHALLYDLNPLRFKDEAGPLRRCIISKTLFPFYGLLVCVVIFAVVVSIFCI